MIWKWFEPPKVLFTIPQQNKTVPHLSLALFGHPLWLGSVHTVAQHPQAAFDSGLAGEEVSPGLYQQALHDGQVLEEPW